jgi:DNA-binding transcriptional LysR family regulator
MADLVTFQTVQRTASITAAARELRVTPSQVSKAIARLEEHFGARLLTRGARGVTLTEAGGNVAGHVARAIAELSATPRVTPSQDAPIELSVAGPSYLLAHLLPVIAASHARVRVRGLELPPAHLRAYITENVFDVALVPGGVEGRPSTWTSDGVGSMRKALLAPPALAKQLAPLPATVERVRALPFVGPTSSQGERFVPIGDDCPLPVQHRRIAHEVQTFGTALELAAAGGYLAFGPVIAARHFLREGSLVEIPVAGWDQNEPLFVLCNGGVVLSRVRLAILSAVRAALSSSGRALVA